MIGGKRPISDSRWSRYGVHAVHVSGRRGRLRYRLVFTDHSQSTAGPFDTPRDALRHAHAVAVKRSRLDGLRVPRVGSERWLWRSGDLEELAAGTVISAADTTSLTTPGPDEVRRDLRLPKGWRPGPGESAPTATDALVLWTNLWSGGALA